MKQLFRDLHDDVPLSTCITFAGIFLVLAVITLVFSVLCGTASQAHADSLVITTSSWHAGAHQRGKDNSTYNETNWGIGYEHVITDDTAIIFGEYKNSYFRHSNYAGYLYQPYHVGYCKGGFALGAITGYTVGQITPMLIPMISCETHDYGVNIGIMPIPPLETHAVIALQFKIKF